MKIKCSVEVLTLNSARTLRRCLESLRNFDDVIVLDGNSTDETLSIAQEFGARILQQSDSTTPNARITDFSAVRNKGLSAAAHRWFLFIDSDEYLSPEAAEEIRLIVGRGKKNTTYVYKMPRKYIVENRIIEHSAMYPNYQIRFFSLDAVHEFIKPVHEKIKIREGYTVGFMEHPEYVPFEDWRILKHKWANYAQLQVAGNTFSPLSLTRFTVDNFLVFVKYLVKYALTFTQGSGLRMPFLYEWHNAYYHMRLIAKAWKSFFATMWYSQKQ